MTAGAVPNTCCFIFQSSGKRRTWISAIRSKVTRVGSDHLKVLLPGSCSNESISQMVMQIGIFLQQSSKPIGNLRVRVHNAIPLQDSQHCRTLASADRGPQQLFTCNSGVIRTLDTAWQLLSQPSDFIGIKNRHCELW